jgi:hypothetical protein
MQRKSDHRSEENLMISELVLRKAGKTLTTGLTQSRKDAKNGRDSLMASNPFLSLRLCDFA